MIHFGKNEETTTNNCKKLQPNALCLRLGSREGNLFLPFLFIVVLNYTTWDSKRKRSHTAPPPKKEQNCIHFKKT